MSDGFRPGIRVQLNGRHAEARDTNSRVGVVLRVDARGVLVALDSGSRVLCEPDHLTIITGRDGAEPGEG